MKKLFIILGFISAIIAVLLAVTPLSNLAIIPIVLGFISGLIIIYLNKKEQTKTKSIQYIFLLVIIALALTLYKGLFVSNEVGDIEQLEQREDENLEDSKEILEGLEIDEDL
ncbi:FUSC family protein [Winogradskyella sp. DF17]|jgi:fructose-specific phosphotransferase system IIC component|uniref:FUSC family protein n=1 Tax=Winogradskyella pelagia TaxID=2819984 RepID=A0ABS3T250_9FLAO|nr:FUSC family protein [Winogradskyella sp. DF17]MBO3116524.1 FUSC family protein [Winogradskyella sp. DF17]